MIRSLDLVDTAIIALALVAITWLTRTYAPSLKWLARLLVAVVLGVMAWNVAVGLLTR